MNIASVLGLISGGLPQAAYSASRAGELAAAVLFLASDASGYITGTTSTVDGGMTIV